MTTTVVESMEENLKRDVIREVRAGEGRILLHDEVEERPGVFSIIPIWEHVEEKDIMTPSDVYNLMVREGYKVGLSLRFVFVASVLRTCVRRGLTTQSVTGRLWPCSSGTCAHSYCNLLFDDDDIDVFPRTDGRTGPFAGRALTATDAREHRSAERPAGRLHLQLPDGPRSYDEWDDYGMSHCNDDDVGTREGGDPAGGRRPERERAGAV